MKIQRPRNPARRRALALVALLLLAAAAPATSSARTRTEYRAFWVDTFNTLLDNHTQVLDVISRAKQAKANAIFVQVRRRGDSWYLDSLEPLGDRRTFTPVGFDPLRDLITEAHKPENNLEVHAFVIVGALWNRDPRCATLQPPAGHAFISHGGFDPVTKNVDPNRDDNWLTRTLLPDTGPHQLTCQTATPNISFNGQRFGAEFWIDLGHPDAAEYTHNVLMHLVRKYDIDGLHLDRIRYPEFAATGQTPTNGTNIGYNKTSVRRFNERYGRTGNPLPSDAAWKQWRRDQVTNFVRRIYLSAIDEKPHLKVSAALIAFGGIGSTEAAWNSAEAYWRVYQDWRAWTEEGILDIAIPMAYKREHNAEAATYDQWDAWLRAHLYDRAGLMGQGGLLNAVEGTLRQTRRTLTPAGGTNLSGIIFYSMATSNVAVPTPPAAGTNPFALPAPTPTGVRSFPEYASGLTTGKSVNGLTLYEPAGQTPIFDLPAERPTLSWKLAPTVGHLKGEFFGADGKPLDTAAVTVENMDTHATRSTATDGNGFFGSVDLTPGPYAARAGGSYQCFNVVAGAVADAVPDTLAPVTTAAPAPATPDGQNGWYTTDVGVTLSTSDNCSGVASTEYSTDGGQTWHPYAGAFTVSTEGTNFVLYRSTDVAGNAETAGSLVVKIDKTAPALSLTATPGVIWPANNQPFEVSLAGAGSDAASGLASVTYVVTDEYGTPLSIPARALSGASAEWAEAGPRLC
ncbi:MAG: family 10 glycosylhydrolase [Acidobacteria bacterium]|nr:family 10 glycosylhydrolase [Acidobacteriota bacterium]